MEVEGLALNIWGKGRHKLCCRTQMDLLWKRLSSLCKPHNRSHALSVIITQPWVKDPRNPHKQKDPGAQGRQAVHAWGGSGDEGFRLSMAGRTGLH